MTDLTSTLPAPDPQANRLLGRTFLRALVAALIVAGGVVAMNGMEKAFHLTFNKPPMPLQKPLGELDKYLGSPVQYEAHGPDQSMTEDIVEVLGTRDYLLRRYRDIQKPADSPLGMLHLNLNYYSRGSSTPHVPEICWAGNGMIEAVEKRTVFDIPNVRRRDGRSVNLRVRMISFFMPGSRDTERLKNVAYLFEVNGEYVATAREVTSRFWKASNKYAYDTKIEVTVGDDKQYCSQEEARAAVSKFLRTALPAIEECLPDPNYAAPAKSATTARGNTK